MTDCCERRVALIIGAASLVVSILSAMPMVSYAATGLTIQPIKIVETLHAGESTSGNILLTNASDGPVDVEISKQDFVPVSGAEGIQFVGRTAGITSVIDWIKVDGKITTTFEKGQSREISYTITAPPNAEPGSHFGVILFKATPKSEGGASLKIGTQVGVLVLVAIPGNHLQKGRILNFSTEKFLQSGPVLFSINFENTGTVHFEPRGNIAISNMFGQKIADVPIEGQVVLPTNVKTLTEQWNVSGILLGRYTAVATIVDGDGNTLTSESVNFWVVPIWYAVSFIFTLVILFFIIRFIKTRVKISIVSK